MTKTDLPKIRPQPIRTGGPRDQRFQEHVHDLIHVLEVFSQKSQLLPDRALQHADEHVRNLKQVLTATASFEGIRLDAPMVSCRSTGIIHRLRCIFSRLRYLWRL